MWQLNYWNFLRTSPWLNLIKPESIERILLRLTFLIFIGHSAGESIWTRIALIGFAEIRFGTISSKPTEGTLTSNQRWKEERREENPQKFDHSLHMCVSLRADEWRRIRRIKNGSIDTSDPIYCSDEDEEYLQIILRIRYMTSALIETWIIRITWIAGNRMHIEDR